MKKLLILVCCLCLFACAGCGDYIEPERRQLITVLGIDPTDDGIRLTAESLDNGVSANQTGNTRLAYGSGAGIEEALADLENGSLGKILFSQCPILLISNRLDAGGRQSVWDFCLDGHFISPALELTACDSAQELLESTEDSGRITGYELLELLRRAKQIRGMTDTDGLARIVNDTGRYCLPFTQLKDGDFTITGLSLFADNALTETLDLDRAQLLFVLMGRFSGGKIICNNTLLSVAFLHEGRVRNGQLPLCFGLCAEPTSETVAAMQAELAHLIARPSCRPFLQERKVTSVDLSYTVVRP